MESKDGIEAVSGQGLRGDRYFSGTGTHSESARDVNRELSLMENEAPGAVARDDGVSVGPDEHRRNLTTSGIGLNRLVGKRFRVGEVVCEGVELCEPCSCLESLLERGGRPECAGPSRRYPGENRLGRRYRDWRFDQRCGPRRGRSTSETQRQATVSETLRNRRHSGTEQWSGRRFLCCLIRVFRLL